MAESLFIRADEVIRLLGGTWTQKLISSAGSIRSKCRKRDATDVVNPDSITH